MIIQGMWTRIPAASLRLAPSHEDSRHPHRQIHMEQTMEQRRYKIFLAGAKHERITCLHCSSDFDRDTHYLVF